MEGLRGKRILVTGGTGFIGGHLVEELLKQDAKVIVIDIKLDPHSTFAIGKLQKRTTLEFVDIRNKKKVFAIFNKYNPVFVFHLAAEPTVLEGFDNPYSAFETNIMGTVHVLEAARAARSTKGVIVASSDKAYGKTKKAYKEDSPLRPDHPYDVSKASADLIAQAYFATYKTPVVITRFGNVYGEGDLHLDRIIPGICEAIIKNKPLEIRSNGNYIRDYIYVKDVVDGYLKLLIHINTIHGEAYNFSSTDTLSVLDLIDRIERVLKINLSYIIRNTAQNEIPYQHLDDRKIRKLGWRPKYSLASTLRNVLKWYKQIL